MGGLRVTESSIAKGVINNLQANIKKLGKYQEQLSSGKLVSKASDDPGATVAAMQTRNGITRQRQYSENAADGLGWLGSIDTTLTSVVEQVIRVRDLAVQGMNTGASDDQAQNAIATEISDIREAILGLANTTYLDRPIFGGTTTGTIAFDSLGTYVGDSGTITRTIADNTKVRVDFDGEQAFGAGTAQLFTVLDTLATDIRNSSPTVSLSSLDDALDLLRTAQSTVGARYNQMSNAQTTSDDRVLEMTTQLSNIEDIDLPKTITDLQLQETAYQAALSATAKVIQPSLVDFLK